MNNKSCYNCAICMLCKYKQAIDDSKITSLFMKSIEEDKEFYKFIGDKCSFYKRENN